MHNPPLCPIFTAVSSPLRCPGDGSALFAWQMLTSTNALPQSITFCNSREIKLQLTLPNSSGLPDCICTLRAGISTNVGVLVRFTVSFVDCIEAVEASTFFVPTAQVPSVTDPFVRRNYDLACARTRSGRHRKPHCLCAEHNLTRHMFSTEKEKCDDQRIHRL